jgi:hypothetical protein
VLFDQPEVSFDLLWLGQRGPVVFWVPFFLVTTGDEKEAPNCITLPMKTCFDLGKACENNIFPTETISHMGITHCVEVNLTLP